MSSLKSRLAQLLEERKNNIETLAVKDLVTARGPSESFNILSLEEREEEFVTFHSMDANSLQKAYNLLLAVRNDYEASRSSSAPYVKLHIYNPNSSTGKIIICKDSGSQQTIENHIVTISRLGGLVTLAAWKFLGALPTTFDRSQLEPVPGSNIINPFAMPMGVTMDSVSSQQISKTNPDQRDWVLIQVYLLSTIGYDAVAAKKNGAPIALAIASFRLHNYHELKIDNKLVGADKEKEVRSRCLQSLRSKVAIWTDETGRQMSSKIDALTSDSKVMRDTKAIFEIMKANMKPTGSGSDRRDKQLASILLGM